MFLPYYKITANSKKNINEVGPLLETKWGKSGLYQTFTPRITKSCNSDVWLGQAYLGCTAVATAQDSKILWIPIEARHFFNYSGHFESRKFFLG